MLFDSWSIGLLSCSVITIFCFLVGSRTALRVLKHWNIGSDSEQQISLEEEIYLVAVLMEFAFVVELVSVLLLVLAADHFSGMLTGAMCATGAFTANIFGMPALLTKLLLLFLSAIWIFLHRLDISSYYYPLVKIKYFLLIGILPIVIFDGFVLYSYLEKLDPEIITSCCGVIFSDQDVDGFNLLQGSNIKGVLLWYSVITGSTILTTLCMTKSHKIIEQNRFVIAGANIILWLLFYLLSFIVITIIVSPYVYAMPHHRCPFDLIKYPYYPVGIPLYLFLHIGCLAGILASVSRMVQKKQGLESQALKYSRRSVWISVLFLLMFLVTAAWPPIKYLAIGGDG